MRRALAFVLLLLAGEVLAQPTGAVPVPGTGGCAPGGNCVVKTIRTTNSTGDTISASVAAGTILSFNGTASGLSARGLQWNAGSARIQFLTGGSPVWFTDNNTGWSTLRVGGIDSSMTPSGSNALSISSGARLDVGSGSSDFFASDSSNILVGGSTAATALNWIDAVGDWRLEQSHHVYGKRTIRYQPDAWESTNFGQVVGVGAIGAVACTQTSGGGTIADNTTEAGFVHVKLRTTAVANNIAQWVSPALMTKRNAGPRLSARLLHYQTAAVRYWIGFVPTALLGSVDSAAANYAAFRFSTNAADAAWQACSGDGAASSCTSTGVAVDTTASHVFTVDCRAVSACHFWIDNTLAVTKTTNLPTATSLLKWQVSAETLAAAEKNVAASALTLETN